MYLNKVNIKEFKEVIYSEYKKIFPETERKPYKTIERSYNNNITDIIEIIVENEFVGFFITNFIENNPYVQLDYFAILPQYQNKGYGTNAIKLLKEEYKNYGGIFVEIERVGEEKNKEENHIRQRRANFYEKLGFVKMGFDLDLFKVIYSAYMLPCKEKSFSEEKVIRKIFDIYATIVGKERIEKNYKVLRKDIYE